MKELGDVLARLATRPEASWPELVAQKFLDDPALAAQALIWLRTNRERVDDEEITPVLADERYQLGVLLDVGATASVWQAHDAHLRNVFHRDLKPHNVLITPFSRRARIADFGLAISESRSNDGTLEIAGTPGYIAPEQAAGLSPHLDPHDLHDRAVLVGLDVWGLGALAFDLVADRAPWQADAGFKAWERAAIAVVAPELPREVPARLRRIIAKALSLDPKARYATAGELADDLDALRWLRTSTTLTYATT